MLKELAVFIKVVAAVRYWDDAEINGVVDERGDLVPFRKGDDWVPIIQLEDGQILNWPAGTTAKIHYKVCDAGEYFLLDQWGVAIAKYADFYVPSEFLCHGSDGYDDYIIFNVDEKGMIANWTKPEIDLEQWNTLAKESTND